MKTEQIYTRCLAQAAYYVVSRGEAAIIDPLRDTDSYLEQLERDGAVLKYIFETHFHADFVSGHLDLARRTGAPIIYGPTASPAFDAVVASDGEEFRLGGATIKVLHTPGHTLESSCFLLSDEDGKPSALFSGDTLFLGDAGRPDLAQKAAGMTREELAGLLYDSISGKIAPLPDDVVIYPGHGAGSACGKNMMEQTTDTLGNQKRFNYALRQPDRESFVSAILDGLLPPPGYFAMNAALNKNGCEELDTVARRGVKPLSAGEFASAAASGALILDTRSPDEFAHGFIPGAVNITLETDFAPLAGTLIADADVPILIVAESGRELEAVVRLARVGFDNAAGYLDGGFAAWEGSGRGTDTLARISAEGFAAGCAAGCVVIDLRRPSEFAAGHADGAVNLPLEYIGEWAAGLDGSKRTVLYCGGGLRSMAGASILRSRGFSEVCDIEGGYNALAAQATLAAEGGGGRGDTQTCRRLG